MIEETVKVVADEKFPLTGILTIPDGLPPFRAAVLVHGSGPNNLDEQIGKTALFRDLATDLAARGIATLRYDKRTLVYGKKMLADKALTVREETIDDALAATRLIQEDSRIDRTQVYLIGHSMGAMLAPRIDAEGGNFAGLILMAGSPRRLEEISLSQNEAVLAELDEATKQQMLSQVEALKALYDSIDTMSDTLAQQTPLLPNVMAYYFKEWGAKPVANYLAELTKPLLVLQGDKDFQVSVAKDFGGYQTLLAGRKNAICKLYPELNHVLMPWQGKTIMDGLAEYETENHLAAEVAEDVIDFILKGGVENG